jgi:hypothetical protein
VSPATLPDYGTKIKAFYEEHIHTDEEIRFVLEGSGAWGGRAGSAGEHGGRALLGRALLPRWRLQLLPSWGWCWSLMHAADVLCTHSPMLGK